MLRASATCPIEGATARVAGAVASTAAGRVDGAIAAFCCWHPNSATTNRIVQKYGRLMAADCRPPHPRSFSRSLKNVGYVLLTHSTFLMRIPLTRIPARAKLIAIR